MKVLSFEKVNGMNVCEFVPSSEGMLVVNRAKAGLIRVSVRTDNTTSVVVDTSNDADYAVGINYTDITVKVESEIDVVKAEYSGDI